jgi:hypothetical protein
LSDSTIYSYNANKTECKRDHEYVEGSFKVRTDKHGHVHRECILCRRIKRRERRSGVAELFIDPHWDDYGDGSWLDSWSK